jgi:hypothetical protein
MDTRTVIAEFTAQSFSSKDVWFPLVCAWIGDDGRTVQANLKEAFPGWGAVFVGANVCDRGRPVEGQFGLFSCSHTNSGKATWSVNQVEGALSEVIVVPAHVSSYLRFYEWLKTEATPMANIFSGGETVYVELPFCSFVVGPFTRNSMGLTRFLSEGMLFHWKRGDLNVWRLNDGGPCFVDGARLHRDSPFPATAAALVKKVCGLLNGKLESERKLKAFAEAVAELRDSEFIPGAIPEVSQLLEAVGQELVHDQALVAAILGNKHLSEALEARWLQEHKNRLSEVDSLKAETTSLQARKRVLDAEHKSVESELRRKREEAALLEADADRAKLAAQVAFDKELAILAAEPAKVAVLRSILSPGNTAPVPAAKASPFLVRSLTAGKWANLGKELASIGVSGYSSGDLTVVCHAAFSCGQPIWIRSIFSELLAKALLASRGHDGIWYLDVPAGLLEPLALPAEAADGKAILVNHANRSDLSLVWAGFRERLLRQVVRPGDDILDVVLTLEPNSFLSVKQDLPFGPILDDAYFGFGLPKELEDGGHDVPSEPRGITDAATFNDEVGATMLALEPMKLSSFRMTCRIVFSALQTLTKNHPIDAKRLLFKYWVLPRVDVVDALPVFTENSKQWSSDSVLNSLGEKGSNDALS